MSDISYKLLPDGGFVCGERVTGLTAYAYPTSTNATKARKEPLKVAQAMLAAEYASFRQVQSVREGDAWHWVILGRESPSK